MSTVVYQLQREWSLLRPHVINNDNDNDNNDEDDEWLPTTTPTPPPPATTGLKSGAEAAIHAMHDIFDSDDTKAVLLTNASNAFNSLNRASALYNVAALCPTLAPYASNTYRASVRLFVTGGKELKSTEGTTQGGPLAMILYALSLQPLITHLNLSSNSKQCWYADDATGAGSLVELKKWWDGLNEIGPR